MYFHGLKDREARAARRLTEAPILRHSQDLVVHVGWFAEMGGWVIPGVGTGRRG